MLGHFPARGCLASSLHSWVPPRALLHWDAGSAVGGPRCLSGLVTKEPGLAAWDSLEFSILWGRRQALGSGSQECIKVLQPCDLNELQVRQGPHSVVRTVRAGAGTVSCFRLQVMADELA